jgi:hypothetical protein
VKDETSTTSITRTSTPAESNISESPEIGYSILDAEFRMDAGLNRWESYCIPTAPVVTTPWYVRSPTSLWLLLLVCLIGLER